MDKLKFKVIIGSTRQGRFSDKPGNWIYDELKEKEEVDAELLDLRDYPMPFFDSAVSPSMPGYQISDSTSKKWQEKIGEADAFIIVAPEYNHGYTAVLKNAIDMLYKEWNNKVVGFVSYGSAGGSRSIEQLRQVAIELKMFPIHDTISIPHEIVVSASKEKVPANPELFAPLRSGPRGDRVEAFFNQLLVAAKAMKVTRN